ncbi:2-amino-4-hydroxy-6-hydroxymethyldihydropteridine diphosphokinase [Roseovarius sp. C7]|uniref:2-amino-4-hydroxy-6- hydroxymethyldihydropteridine diphosphokinase n=1 Tax=Roseovarius sp. C7 TaxID=3398643 RepID=UPI0039F58529
MVNTSTEYVCLVALGGNLSSAVGSPRETLAAAIDMLGQIGLRASAVSRDFQTPCFPAGAGPDYVNAAARIETALGAQEVLTKLHEVEAHFGRERETRWGRRTLDLDLLAWGQEVLPDRARYLHWQGLSPQLQAEAAPDELILPHPRIQDRAFVLVPLLDVAPDWVHPVLGQSVRQMAEKLPKEALNEVVPL